MNKEVTTLNDFFSTLQQAVETKTDQMISLNINNKRIDGNYRYNNNYELAGFQNLFVYFYENSNDYTPTKTFTIKESINKKISTSKIETIKKKVEKII